MMINRQFSRFLLLAIFLSLGNSQAQNLINVKVAGGTPGAPSGAAVVGTVGDAWNYFPSMSGRASGGGVVTNASVIKDSSGATLGGVTMTMSLSAGDGLDSFSDTSSFQPDPVVAHGQLHL